MTVADFLEHQGARIDAFLDSALPAESSEPAELHRAVRYTVFAGGKRFRPALAIATCGALGGDDEACMPAAAAIEMIHVSSLIHDDLPCMDDSDVRRGRPSCHRAFGESTAVLAGDWLLVHPFELVAQQAELGVFPASVAVDVTATLARAVCSSGIIAGQVEDLSSESRVIGPDDLERIHVLKTAALIEASAGVGAAVAQAPTALRDAARRSARALGLCFQVVDDLLDVVGDTEALGKPTGADERQSKNTYVSLFGVDGAQRRASNLAEEARSWLSVLPSSEWLERLRELVDFVLRRTT